MTLPISQSIRRYQFEDLAGCYLAIQMASAAPDRRVALALPGIGRSTDANCASLRGAAR